jgi:hypothetical protein
MLEAEIKKLEAEYNMYFGGQLPRPPWETRGRVEALLKRYDRTAIPNYADRFRLEGLQTRYAKFVDLWDRGLRAREEGRPGPFFNPQRTRVAESPRAPEDRIVHVTVFNDPMQEVEKLRDLYEKLADARREAGASAPPFHKFATLVRNQVRELKKQGVRDVAFRVALEDGKVRFTAKGLKGAKNT